MHYYAAFETDVMEEQVSSETLVNFYQTTRSHIPKESGFRCHRRETLA
jgi:hypothetical protein